MFAGGEAGKDYPSHAESVRRDALFSKEAQLGYVVDLNAIFASVFTRDHWRALTGKDDNSVKRQVRFEKVGRFIMPAWRLTPFRRTVEAKVRHSGSD